MEKTYKEIEYYFGDIDGAVKKLIKHKERGELVFIEFNGKKLYSDVDDLDSAYLKITGKTKVECEEAEQKRQEEYREEERKHKEAIPQLTKEWIEKGNEILDEKYHELWASIVPTRLDDLYRGMELKDSLDIIKELNAGSDFKTAKDIIENQGHSGMSFSLVCSMLKSFCDRGAEFVAYVR